MTREELKEQVMELLQSLEDAEAVEVNNEYCEAHKYFDDRVFYISEIDEYCDCQNYSPSDVLNSAIDGGYTRYSEFFKDGIYGLEFFENFDLVNNGVTSIGGYAEFVIEQGGNLNIDELQELFDEYADEQEEEGEEA